MAENGNRTGKVGKGNPPKDKQFSKENQPSGEAKSKGWKKKRELKDLANALITGDAKKNAAATAQLVGIDLSDQEYTIEVIMTLKQIEKALEVGDTKAYNAAMDRMQGKPKQSLDVVVEDATNNVKLFNAKDIEKDK